jgi:hypothetical protein
VKTTETSYLVECLRSGQPRPYADHANEYLITIRQGVHNQPDKPKPWVLMGDVEGTIRREEAARAAGTMFGGNSPDDMRKQQRDWAKSIVRALCHDFQENGDEGHNWASWTLASLKIDPHAGTIRALITAEYTG